ncbi:cbb3-type cytochrome oxidase assembly protein CcoS [Endozoicomonas lisbonensis]|uniref:Cbb3-type cytochrome oxidase maturation protein n=1 Tax=Endozoicomonas lisbonensis TaxID=3120522 RepID=A0ABV2SKY2_9GAMM
MESLFILIPLAVLFIALAIRVFFWAVDSGQFDDLEGPAHSILYEDKTKKPVQTDARQGSEKNNPLQS